MVKNIAALAKLEIIKRHLVGKVEYVITKTILVL